MFWTLDKQTHINMWRGGLPIYIYIYTYTCIYIYILYIGHPQKDTKVISCETRDK